MTASSSSSSRCLSEPLASEQSMASAEPHIVAGGHPDDEEDDFDWDAAVRAIDLACDNPKPYTSAASADPFLTPCFASSDALHRGSNAPFAADRRRNGASRQSTLDKFIGRAGPRADLQNRAVAVEDRGEFDSNCGTSCVEIDAEAAKTWIYPVNVPRREYQFAITRTALFTNTLVALPTGLGKTLIAAVVMYNYFRWFPEGKIVFTAPSRPLVLQQIEACHNIVGIPQEMTIDMTGQICPTKRADFWKTKRVFFVTPQILERDIQSGTCLVKYLVCLVIDEAHRATGNHASCVAVRELMAIPVQLRLLALTATPGSKQQAIQHVIDNLFISCLEYRDENDPDVIPYSHNRKLELIQVALGDEAVQIDSLLLNVVRFYAARLNAMGIPLTRDCQTMSPPDYLNSRDKFRQAPPPELPQVKYGEVERFLGALITLAHVRKLLSSHGIRPAYEMLAEKLQQGSFAGLMSRNEDIQKAKLLMQQNLSRGAPNPKVAKMLEVLIDHFKNNDKQSSRVIIFSNFRGSVRDIMESLSKVGDTVKAAQFVGQSSGKSLKGQSQKVQQAVLEKFRTGGYNVIVATSIGEEGLDILEVDLVICFDANVSPLRMVQRMGRTGRKHDGRVVVLACEGSEMKGYMGKQAKSKTIKKQMRNGGIASFNFHASPRMLPHIFKPEVQYVELSIENFVPRGKKVKDDQATETPIYIERLTSDEANLITKYFKNPENEWKPSLIAFPHFQTFPSGVHKVMHSCRTGMLIDSMQYLQGDIFCGTKDEEEDSMFQQMRAQRVGQQINDEKETSRSRESPDTSSEKFVLHSQASPTRTTGIMEKHDQMEVNSGNPPSHSCLFGSDFVTVDAIGNVSILLVPSLHVMRISDSHSPQSAINVEHPNCVKTECEKSRTSAETSKLQSTPAKGPSGQNLSRGINVKDETGLQFGLCSQSRQQNGPVDTVVRSMELDITDDILRNEIDCPGGTLDAVKGLSVQEDHVMETELSPRLTNYVESGIVPESPIAGASTATGRGEFHVTDVRGTPRRAKTKITFCSTSRSPSSGIAEKVILDSFASEGNISDSPANKMKNSSLNNMEDGIGETCAYRSPISEVPQESTSSGCCSKDWCFTPRENPGIIQHQRKLKRLRRVGEDDEYVHVRCRKSSASPLGDQNNHNRGKNLYMDGRAYIEEEAEVSSGADTSDGDEEDAENDDSYDDSFIDDRANPTAGSTQAATASVDMMAIYRRSLLSQSPIARQANSTSTSSPDSVTAVPASGSGSSVIHAKSRMSGASMYAPDIIPDTGEASKVGNRKRKLTLQEHGSLPAINLENEFLIHTEDRKEENTGDGCDLFSDDQFYEGIDLDEVEAQATLLLKNKSDLSQHQQPNVPEDVQSFGCISSPSFDLGI